jgi:methylamine---glutamate N-methyltransferase subunit A
LVRSYLIALRSGCREILLNEFDDHRHYGVRDNMCGIVGLFLKEPSLKPELGRHLATMLDVMCDRGPDSAGFAVYGDGRAGRIKMTVRLDDSELSAADLAAELTDSLDETVGHDDHDGHAVLYVPERREAEARAIVAAHPQAVIVGTGRHMEIFKGVGEPRKVADTFGLARMRGTHGIGHTRMATESAVTVDGSHPYSTGTDQCLVHNGSLSNHNDLRRRLVKRGYKFQTENDSEVAATYLTWRMSEGATLGEALEASLADLDGFFTFVVGTGNGFGVLRDAISCKPAVLAETDQFVAFGSEYRALASLPGIESAKVWEPEPATVYFWERPA